MSRDVSFDVVINGTNIDNFNPLEHFWGQWDTVRCKNKEGQWRVWFSVGNLNPLPIFIELSAKYPELTFEFYYLGNGDGFAGELTYKAGVCTKNLEFAGDEYDAYFAANYYIRPATAEEVARLTQN